MLDLLTERRLRDVLALRRVGEGTLLRHSDKIPELMNFHRTILRCERRFVESHRSRHEIIPAKLYRLRWSDLE
jgi:hypothetical protein